MNHGLSHTGAYKSWINMRSRCLSPTKDCYHRYGGRGIRICKRWMRFKNFYTDMGDRPSGNSLERKDVNGHYEPSNCIWATPKQQGRNRRYHRLITYRGETMCLSAWCERLGVTHKLVHTRIKRGWSLDRALFHDVWKDKKEQARHSQRIKELTYQGKTLCVTEWCERLGLKTNVVFMRLRRGWSTEEALTQKKFKPFGKINEMA